MTCACACAIDYDADGPSVYAADVVRARIHHVCCECGGAILPGQRYERVAGLWDRHWGHYDTCAPCLAIRSDLCPGGWIHGGLRMAWIECHGWDYLEMPEDEP